WLFVLLDEAENYVLPEPKELARNGSFAVFKMIRTDVVGFENFLQSHKDRIDPELLAAKMCGRWRNGVPLALSPDTDKPPGGISPDELNDFEYVNADGSGDPKGLRCPVGAHIRRINPRGQPVIGQGRSGGSNNTHRLIRRGMPYGPTYDRTKPYDGIERGLLGYFINSSIENQYEFVLSQWVNDAEFAGSVRLPPKSRDPIIGTQNPEESIFAVPQVNGPPIKVTGFSSFITTRAAAYFAAGLLDAECHHAPPQRCPRIARGDESAHGVKPGQSHLVAAALGQIDIRENYDARPVAGPSTGQALPAIALLEHRTVPPRAGKCREVFGHADHG